MEVCDGEAFAVSLINSRPGVSPYFIQSDIYVATKLAFSLATQFVYNSCVIDSS